MTTATILTPARMWRDYPRESVVLVTLAAAAMAALAGAADSTPTLSGLRSADVGPGVQTAPPAPPPLLVRKLAPEDAISVNRAIPLADGPNPAARPFLLKGADEATRARALECLTSAVYYEAATESSDGQKAVAQVVLNRVRHPAFPASVCEVVYQGSTRRTGCQFSFTCDGSLARQPSSAGWARARDVAQAALRGAVFDAVGYATHYHAYYVVPYWAASLAKNAVVGAHNFYRWSGGWGRAPAFGQRHSGREPDSAALRSAAIAAESATDALATVVEAVEAIPGAELKAPDDGRVAIRFNLAARKAVEAAPHKPYVDKVGASDNLRWSLTGGLVAEQEKPLGAAPSTTSSGNGSPQP